VQKALVHTKGKPMAIDLGIELMQPCRVRIIARNPKSPNIVYYDRQFFASKNEEMEIRLPQSKNEVEVIVACFGMPQDNIRITKLKKVGLKQYPSCYNRGRTLRFVRFAQQICERLPELTTGDYYSLNNEFHLQVFDTIPNTQTPARIHNDLGVIQVSKQKMGGNTVPMNMAILLHEYSHFYMNKIQVDEIEADINGLKIYLGLGYPIVESHKSFTDVFQHSDNPMNRERYAYIFEFVDRFEKTKHRICL